MDDSTPRQRAEADDSLASWTQETCPELPDIIRKHIQTMTNIDGQGQDVLVRLVMVSIRDKMWKTNLALKIIESVQDLSINKICSALIAQGLTGSSRRMRDVKELMNQFNEEIIQ